MKSIITYDLNYCIICGKPNPDMHHCIGGTANRDISDRYGLIVPLCKKHHTDDTLESAHLNPVVNRMWKIVGQMAFESKIGTRDDFRRAFGKSYI